MSARRYPFHLAAAALVSLAGCQLLTGTGDLKVVDSLGGAGGAGGTAGSGGTGAEAAGGTGGCGGAGCDGCDRDCLGGDCIQGECQARLLFSSTDVHSIAVDGDFLYWTMTTASLFRCTLPDCTDADSIKSLEPGSTMTDLAINPVSARLFWAASDMAGAFISGCSAPDCTDETAVLSPAPVTDGLAAGGENVYFTSSGSLQACAAMNCADRFPYFSDAQTSVAADASHVYFLSSGAVTRCDHFMDNVCDTATVVASDFEPPPSAIAVDDKELLVAAGTTVHGCDKRSCSGAVVATTDADVQSLASDGLSVFWYDGAAIWRIAK